MICPSWPSEESQEPTSEGRYLSTSLCCDHTCQPLLQPHPPTSVILPVWVNFRSPGKMVKQRFQNPIPNSVGVMRICMFSKGPRKLMPLVWGPHCELRQRMVCEPNPSFPVDGQFASALWILGGGGAVGEAEVRTAPSLRGQQCSQVGRV